MFDINFVMNIQDLKKEIINGKWSNDDLSHELFTKVESMISQKPYLFNIETTNNCNMKCIMCPRTTLMTRKVRTLTEKDFELVLEQITPYTDEQIKEFHSFVQENFNVHYQDQTEDSFYYYIISDSLNLHGYGETIIDPRISLKVQKCTDKGFKTYFSCVPANASVEKSESLMNSGLTYLKFAMESLNDDIQKKIRGPRASFTKAFDTIQKIIKKKSEVQGKTTYIATMLEMGTSEEDKSMQEEFLLKFRDLDLYSYIKTQDNRWLYEESSVETKGSPKEFCEYPFTSLSIMSDGNVVPCTQDYNSEMVMGNIYENTLEEIWHGPKYKKFREYHVRGNFPDGFKCSERCDNLMICDRRRGIIPKNRIM